MDYKYLKAKEGSMVGLLEFAGRDGGTELALLDEGGGGLLVKGGDGVGDHYDISLHRRRLGSQRHRFVLQLIVTASGDGDGLFSGSEFCLDVVSSFGQSGLRLGQVGLQRGSLVVDPSDSVVGGGEVFDLRFGGGDRFLQSRVGGGGGFALFGRLGQDGLELGQTFSHLLATLFLSQLLLQDGHFALHHGVELVPDPVSAVVVETDVPLDGGDTLLLGDLALVGDVDENAASLALHLHEDLGESALTDLLQGGQHTGAEHDLGGTATERVGVHAGLDEGLLGARFGVSGHIGEDLGSDDGITRHEIAVGNLVRQAQHANTDALKHTVAVKLMHDERSVDVSGLLDLVGDDAADEVRMSRVQVGHQLHQRLSVRSRDGHHGGALLLLAGVLLGKDERADGIAGAGHHPDHSLVYGILVLEEPAGNVVSDGAGVMMDLKMSLGLAHHL